MIFQEQQLKGVWLIEPQPIEDERGFFARIACENEFQAHGLTNRWKQQNIAFNKKKGTLRGMHYQKGAAAETKVVRCTKGAIYDVVVDLRPNSATYKNWCGIELTEENRRLFYIPEGFAHGYITLTDAAEVTYLVSNFYTPGAEAGLRYDDPAIKIKWPEKVAVLSDKDKMWPYLGCERT